MCSRETLSLVRCEVASAAFVEATKHPGFLRILVSCSRAHGSLVLAQQDPCSGAITRIVPNGRAAFVDVIVVIVNAEGRRSSLVVLRERIHLSETRCGFVASDLDIASSRLPSAPLLPSLKSLFCIALRYTSCPDPASPIVQWSFRTW